MGETKIGGHIDRLVSAHRALHAGKVAVEQERRESGAVERRERAQALEERFERVLKRHNLWNDKGGTPSFLIDQLEDGTRVAMSLTTNGSYGDQALFRASKNSDYTEKGVVKSQVHRDKVLSEEEAKSAGLLSGLKLHATVQTANPELNVDSQSNATVAIIVDPESLVVPVFSDEEPSLVDNDVSGIFNQTPAWSVIGPDNPQFGAIMSEVDIAFSGSVSPINQGYRQL